MILPDLSQRRLQSELMDDPALDPRRHHGALRALETINALSWSAGRIWKEVLRLSRTRDQPIRVLDLACGGGDIVHALQRRAASAGLSVEIHGCDRSRVALDFARARKTQRGPAIEFFELDLLDSPLPDDYDLLCCSLFFHHLRREDLVDLLTRMSRAAPAVFAQDLLRTSVGHLLARVALHVFTTSDVARVDGLRSVEGAFTLTEIAEIAETAGLRGVDIQRCWPQRFSMSWRRDG
jgi:2-polyprenyl-3-methyl-5-hydroxy-6-metoxy-1,4-benzoquinol methylase